MGGSSRPLPMPIDGEKPTVSEANGPQRTSDKLKPSEASLEGANYAAPGSHGEPILLSAFCDSAQRMPGLSYQRAPSELPHGTDQPLSESFADSE